VQESTPKAGNSPKGPLSLNKLRAGSILALMTTAITAVNRVTLSFIVSSVYSMRQWTKVLLMGLLSCALDQPIV
jgi:hypothetical protein